MKSRIAHLVFLLIASIFCMAWAHADSASGEVRLDKVNFEVVDVVAFPSGDGHVIALTNTPFDKEKMRGDGEVDMFDLLGLPAQTLSINLKKGVPTMCADYYARTEGLSSSGSICQSGFPDAVKITQLDEARVAGSMQWSNERDESIVVKFDVAIEPDSD